MKKLIAVFGFLLVLTSAISANVIPVNAATEVTINGLTISGDGIQEGDDYSMTGSANNALTILSKKEMTISGTATGETRILVTSPNGANIIFSNLTVELYRGNPSAAFCVDANVKGDVNITLKGTNKLQSGEGHAGLENNGVPLTIKGEGEGKLESCGYDGGAGIGGGKGEPGKNITIESGIIIAKGMGGAGIGGGEDGDGEHITINGGKVTAETVFRYPLKENDWVYYTGGGAGIGGGKNRSGRNIEISGGTVIATGMRGAGIGGGLHGDGEYITISGGEVTAKTTEQTGNQHNHEGAAGIGGGCGGNAAYITISAGKVTATGGGSHGGAGIGSGALCSSDSEGQPCTTTGGSCQNVTISGTADVIATGGGTGYNAGAAGIGGGTGGSCDTIIISSSGTIKATGKSGGAGIGGGNYYNNTGGLCENVTISGSGTIIAIGENGGGAGIGGGNKGFGKKIDISGSVKVTATSFNGAGIGGGNLGDGIGITITIDNPEGINKPEDIDNLKDEDIDSLNAYVKATSTDSGAGIGGGSGANGSDITINSGFIKATGSNGAGIGGGRGTASVDPTTGTLTDPIDGKGSNIKINGGAVKAESHGGAGIGGGSYGNGIEITIKGGNVAAHGRFGGAGIGGGNFANGENITINGGSIIADSQYSGAGIGGGGGGSGKDIEINDCTSIKATGGYGGAGIGGGESIKLNNITPMGGSCENIAITGGTYIEANGRSSGAGIGGGGGDGHLGSAKNITITGGDYIKATSASGAGIGSGNGSLGSGTDIKISSGKIEAESESGVGIGGSDDEESVITISGGNVSTAGKSDDASGISGTNVTIDGKNTVVEAYGAGSGAGITGSNIIINDGKVKAEGSTDSAAGINGTTVTIDGENTVVEAYGTGSGAGIMGSNITINDGKVKAEGGADSAAGINGTNVRMGKSETSYPWINTNGINGLTTGGSTTNLAIVFNIDKTEGTIYGGRVELTEPYELKAPCTKLTVKTGAEFITDNKLTLNDSVILYLEAGAKLDKYNKMTIIKGEIQHEDKSIYVPDTTSRAIKMVCDICGKEEPHNWKTEWVNDDPTYHWHECTPGKDCAVVPNDIEVCSITEDSQKDGYGEHEYDFDNPTYGADGRLHYFCKDCNYELIVDIPVIQLIKVDGENTPLAGAEFGLYSDEACTKLNTSTNPNANSTATTATDADHKAVVSFAAELDKTYYIKEIKAPEDYNISKDVFKAVVDKDGKVTYGVVGSTDTSEEIPVCENYAIKVASDPIKIIKVDGETNSPLAGAQFSVYSDEACQNPIASMIGTTAIDADNASDTHNKAVVSFSTEPGTTYYIKETKAPDGYTASDKVFKAVVGKDGKVAYSVVGSTATSEEIPVCENYAVAVTPDPIEIFPAPAKIIKVDGETGAPLAGAQFGIYSDAACKNLITSTNPTATTVIDADKASDTYNKAVVSFDTELNETYYIREITPPKGYTASDKVFKAVVGADGKVTYGIVGSTDTSEEIPVCENYAVKVIVSDPAKIIKVDGETGAPLAGAQFGIYSDAERTKLIKTVTAEIDTDNASATYNKAVASFSTEPNMTYYIKETFAPDGYKVSDEVFKAVVDADGKVTYGTVGSETTSETVPVCENYAVEVIPDPIEIVPDPAKIIKVDSETGSPLAGAQFGIYSDAECTKLITTGITVIDTDNASATYNQAVVSFSTEPNKTYFIKETNAPDGYRVSHEVFKAVVDADGKVTYAAAGSTTTSETVPICKNEKTDEDDDISDLEPDPEDTPPAKAVSPKTGDTSGSGIVGMAILSGITCAVSLVGLVQKRKKKTAV